MSKPVAMPSPAPSPPGAHQPANWKAGLAVLGGWLPVWCRRWDFLLVLASAAVLRLALLGDTSFLGDQADLLALARSALDHHALPATGIRSSIGTLNPPVSIYLVLPFALLGDPFWATLATALANLAAVILLYALADRYSGRLAAFAAGMLYAAGYWPVWFSRFIWQQNLLAPVVLLFFWTACRGVIERRTGWLGWNLLLWGVAVQLHPSAAPLLAVTALAVLLSWRDARPRLRPLSAALLTRAAVPWVLLVALFLPTLAWELASHGSDITALGQYLALRSVLDDAALRTLRAVLAPEAASSFGAGTTYAHAAGAYGWVGPVMVALYYLSVAWLVVALAAHVLGRRGRPSSLVQALAAGTNARYLALLALWQLAPLLPLLRHSTPIHEHYLLAMLPAYFLTMGGFLAWLAVRLTPVLAARSPTRAVWRLLPAGALVLATLVLAAGQTLAVGAEIATVHGGTFDDGARRQLTLHYGLPLADQQRALADASAAADDASARLYVATSPLEQEPFGYLATTGTVHASVYDGTSCLVAPAAGSAPAITLATSAVGAGSVAAELRGAALLRTLSAAGNDPLRIYGLPPGAALPGETRLPASGVGLVPHFAAYAFDVAPDGTRRLLLRWSGQPRDAADRSKAVTYWYGAQPNGPRPASYTFFAEALGANGQPLGTPLAATCSVLSWGAGEDVITWLPLPAVSKASAPPVSWRVWGTRAVAWAARPRRGPLVLETGDVGFGPAVKLPGTVTFTAAPR